MAEGLLTVNAWFGFYIGGMGYAARNFHADLMARRCYGGRARRIRELALARRRDEAVRAVPDAFADEVSLIGLRERIAEWLGLWRNRLVDLLRPGVGATDVTGPGSSSTHTLLQTVAQQPQRSSSQSIPTLLRPHPYGQLQAVMRTVTAGHREPLQRLDLVRSLRLTWWR